MRLTRDLEQVIDLGVNVYAVAAGHLDLSNPAGRAVARTITAWSTYEGEQKAERQKLAAAQRGQGGQALVAHPFPFSGLNVDRATGKVTLNEAEEAKALRKAYRDLLNGASLRTLASSLNSAGHLTCRGNEWRGMTLAAAAERQERGHS